MEKGNVDPGRCVMRKRSGWVGVGHHLVGQDAVDAAVEEADEEVDPLQLVVPQLPPQVWEMG